MRKCLSPQFFALLIVSILISSCALNYTYIYQPDKSIKGKIILYPNTPTPLTYVKLNDSLIIESKYVKNLIIDNLPDGDYKIQYCSYSPAWKSNLNQSYDFNIQNGSLKTGLINVPVISTGYWIYSGLIISSVYFLYGGVMWMASSGSDIND